MQYYLESSFVDKRTEGAIVPCHCWIISFTKQTPKTGCSFNWSTCSSGLSVWAIVPRSVCFGTFITGCQSWQDHKVQCFWGLDRHYIMIITNSWKGYALIITCCAHQDGEQFRNLIICNRFASRWSQFSHISSTSIVTYCSGKCHAQDTLGVKNDRFHSYTPYYLIKNRVQSCKFARYYVVRSVAFLLKETLRH